MRKSSRKFTRRESKLAVNFQHRYSVHQSVQKSPRDSNSSHSPSSKSNTSRSPKRTILRQNSVPNTKMKIKFKDSYQPTINEPKSPDL